MQITILNTRCGGSETFELRSNSCIHIVETFCLQVPPSAKAGLGKSFEIPDSFMNQELDISVLDNPVEWYKTEIEKLGDITATSEKADKFNELFEIFFDAIAKFCHYDRRSVMEERQRMFFI